MALSNRSTGQLVLLAPPPGSPVGYITLLRTNRSFRLLWMGQVVSLLGDWFSLIALATLVASLTGSGMAVGGLFVARMLPPFLISPLAGVAADRFDRKRLLIGADLARMLTVLGFMLVHQPNKVWLLYMLSALQLAFSGFFFPARNAILPSLVSSAELGTANALSSVTWSVMLALGAALGGLVAGRFGVTTAFVIDAITYLCSALLLSRIRAPHLRDDEHDRSLAGAARQYADGLRYLWHHREVLFTGLHKALFGLSTGGALQVIQVAIAQRVFVLGESGSTGLGLIYAAAGAGTGVGPLLARRITGDERGRLRRAIALAYLLVSLGLLVIAPLASFALVLTGVFLRGAGGGINWVFSTQLLMMTLPDAVRGRVFSSEFAAFTLAQAIGTAAGGWALDGSGLSLPALIAVIAALPLVPGALWAWWLRHLEARERRD